jgi:hypothetical protein
MRSLRRCADELIIQASGPLCYQLVEGSTLAQAGFRISHDAIVALGSGNCR